MNTKLTAIIATLTLTVGLALAGTGVPAWVNTNTMDCLPLRSDGGTNNWDEMGQAVTGKVDKAGDLTQLTAVGGTSNQVFKSNGDGTGSWGDEATVSGASTNAGYGFLCPTLTGTGFGGSLTTMNLDTPVFETTTLCDVIDASDYVALKTNGLWMFTCTVVGTVGAEDKVAVYLQVSVDDGSNYSNIGRMVMLNGADSTHTLAQTFSQVYYASSANTERIRVQGIYTDASFTCDTSATGEATSLGGVYLGVP